MAGLDRESRRELRRMQLLDELRGKLTAIEWDPELDPDGRRAGELRALIGRVEATEAEELLNGSPRPSP